MARRSARSAATSAETKPKAAKAEPATKGGAPVARRSSSTAQGTTTNKRPPAAPRPAAARRRATPTRGSAQPRTRGGVHWLLLVGIGLLILILAITAMPVL